MPTLFPVHIFLWSVKPTHPLPRTVLTVSKCDSCDPWLDTVSTVRGSGWVRSLHSIKRDLQTSHRRGWKTKRDDAGCRCDLLAARLNGVRVVECVVCVNVRH